MDRTREKIAAVVVTYNRKHLLGECLDSLLAQSRPLDAIFVVDNCSTDGTQDFLIGRGLLSPAAGGTIRYLRLPENTGSAGGFHAGLQGAVDAGFDWLWLMDDDLLTTPEALDVLVRRTEVLRNRGQESFILGSLVLDRDRRDGDSLAFPLQELSPARNAKYGIHDPRRGIYHWRLSEVRDQVADGLYRWSCPFNGTYVPARAVREVGLPNPELFIWGDEKDWLWRLARRFDFYTAVDSQVFHPRGHLTTFNWKQYYHIRNTLVVNRYFSWTWLRNLKLIFWSLALGLRHGPQGLALVLRAIRDGLTGRLGRRDDLHR